VTATLAALLADRGAEEIVLFTDLDNATSNALYARLGFVGVVDVVDAALVPVARKNV
jgi:predicted GNAT family acetyltransferase